MIAVRTFNPWWLLSIPAALVFMILAAAVGIGFYLPVILLAGGVGAVVFLALPLDKLLLSLVVLVFLVIGVAEYSFGFSQGRWLPFLIGLLLYVKFFVILFEPSRRLSLAGPFGYFLLLMVAAVFGALANGVSAMSAAMAFKSYFPLWSLALIVAVSDFNFDVCKKIFKWMVFVLLVQVPFCLYQYVFVAKNRASSVNNVDFWDSIVGSFGGNPEAGGASGIMGVFVVLMIVFLAALVRDRVISLGRFFAISAFSSLVFVLAEVKIVFFILPFGLMLVFGVSAIRRPLLLLTALCGLAGVFYGASTIYGDIYAKEKKASSVSLEQRIGTGLKYAVNPDYINSVNGEVGRVASINLWLKDSRTTAFQNVFGYGIGASRSRSLVDLGEVAKRYYPLNIDATAFSVLLWDFGLFGTFLYVAMFIHASIMGFRLSGNADVEKWKRASARGFSVCMILLLVTLFYNKAVISFPAIQFFAALAFAFVVKVSSETKAGRTKSAGSLQRVFGV